jgi:hypothetical protein
MSNEMHRMIGRIDQLYRALRFVFNSKCVLSSPMSNPFATEMLRRVHTVIDAKRLPQGKPLISVRS